MQKLSFTYREMLSSRSLAGQSIALAGSIALFVIIGPFGTYDSLTALERLGYWGLAMSANWLVCGSVMMLSLLKVQIGSRRYYVTIVGAALVAAVPGTGVVFTAESLFRPGYLPENFVLTLYPSVAVLMVVIGFAVSTGVARLHQEFKGKGPAAAADVGTHSRVRFFDRLPEKLGRDLIYVRVVDHYIQVITTAGSTLVLMRFTDAINELEGANGLRVHRSYWVAHEHVVEAVRENGRTVLRLTGGHEVPVSRSYLGDVRTAGLLQVSPCPHAR